MNSQNCIYPICTYFTIAAVLQQRRSQHFIPSQRYPTSPTHISQGKNSLSPSSITLLPPDNVQLCWGQSQPNPQGLSTPGRCLESPGSCLQSPSGSGQTCEGLTVIRDKALPETRVPGAQPLPGDEQGGGLTGGCVVPRACCLAQGSLWEPASPLLFSFREAAASPANIYKEKTGFNLTVLGKEDADGVKGAFATR